MEPRIKFSEEMSSIYGKVILMGEKIEENFDLAFQAFKSGNLDLSKHVKSADFLIDQMQTEIEDYCAVIIAREQPVATDLREIITVLKIVTELERIGDHARHLAKATGQFDTDKMDIGLPYIEKMLKLGLEMMGDALEAFRIRDLKLAEEVAKRDDKIDAEHKKFYEQILQAIRQNPEQIEKEVPLLFLNRYLERLGDRVTNICEWVMFSITGKHYELNK